METSAKLMLPFQIALMWRPLLSADYNVKFTINLQAASSTSIRQAPARTRPSIPKFAHGTSLPKRSAPLPRLRRCEIESARKILDKAGGKLRELSQLAGAIGEIGGALSSKLHRLRSKLGRWELEALSIDLE